MTPSFLTVMFSNLITWMQLLQKFGFYQDLYQVFLMDFICEESEPSYPRLVRIFYANLDFKDGVLISEVCKVRISIMIDNFGIHCNLVCFGKHATMMLHLVVKTSNYLSLLKAFLLI